MSEQQETQEPNPSFFELGDVIKIIAPSNSDINDKVYLIQYLDENEMDILDVETLNKSVLTITDGNLDDQSIETIEIISKPDEEGFARQNNLLPGTWITLQLGGDIPMTINGEITNLEEDMIEINTWPDEKKIYIDFGYKGIPKNLPIESIRPFAPPQKEDSPSPQFPEIDEDVVTEREGEEEITPTDVDIDMAVPNVEVQRKEILLDADDIVFGEKLGTIVQEVPVSESERRYGIDTQSDDLLNDLLSTIPTSARSKKVLAAIHIMVERYQQLRQEFSKLSTDGEYDIPDTKGAEYRPLVQQLKDFNAQLYWLLPISKNKKYLYNIETDAETDTSDIAETTLGDAQTRIYEIVNQYMTNNVPDGENKYTYLYRHLNDQLTPFINPMTNVNTIISSRVNKTLPTIVGNFEGSISSAVCKDKVEREKFVIQRYEEPLKRPFFRDLKKRNAGEMTNLMPGDNLYLQGFLQLPQAFMRYSQINLPQTRILMKAKLNTVPFTYFNYLNDSYPQEITTTTITENQIPSKNDRENFMNDFEMFLFEEVKNIDERNIDVYTNFLTNFIPRTRSLFNMLKKDMKNVASYLNILYYLQPFMIYPDDITFKQYEEIVTFMRGNILKFKKDLVKNNTSYINYISHKYQQKRENMGNEIFNTGFKNSYLFNLLKHDDKSKDIYQAYKLGVVGDDMTAFKKFEKVKSTTPEFIKRIYTSDSGRLFTNAISLEDIDLFVGMDVDTIIKNKLDSIDSEQKVDQTQSDIECKNFTLAKYYIDIDALKEDDGKQDIYFDTKYDDTRYDIIKEFSDEQAAMSPTEFNNFLLNHLTKNVGLDETSAAREARAMMEGKRKIVAGDYCYTTNIQGLNIFYVRDENNMWIHKSEYDGESLNSSMFCNLKKNCMSINKECATMDLNKFKVKKQLMNEMLTQFSDELQLTREEMVTKLNKNEVELLKRIAKLNGIANLYDIVYDEIKFALGQQVEERNITSSPFSELRDLILSQTDFVKKQTDILRFIEKTCVQSWTWDPDDPGANMWFYCNKTNKKLLPSFYERLAEAYFAGSYTTVLEQVVAERGQISDDGDKIVDKYSGYTIKMIEFDEAEGFDEAGYKIVSRGVLNKDIGDVLMDMSFKPSEKLKSKDGTMINNVITTLQQQMGVSIGSYSEFVIKNVESTLDNYLPSEEAYSKQIKIAKSKGKRLGSYVDLHDEALLLLTLGYFLVATQTVMPSITTNITFRGCGPKSFVGYPLEGPGDFSALRYICCCALRLRSRTRPWQRLPRLTREKATQTLKDFMTKLKKLIDSEILKNRSVKEKIDAKLLYLQNEAPGEDIPFEFDVKRWLTFLPPLFPVRVKEIQPLPAVFKENLLADIRSANPRQFQRVSTLYGKMTLLSMHILELIQKVVNKETLLLSNTMNEMLVENACCNVGPKVTREYFEEKEGSIRVLNNNVFDYGELYNMFENMIVPYYLFDPTNTKLKYPSVPKTFSETTIYRAFIRFCYYNTGITLSDQLERVCGENSSAFKLTDDIAEKIDILKREGKNYSQEDFIRLMNIVNAANTVSVEMYEDIVSPRTSFERLLKNEDIINDAQSDDLEIFMELMNNVLDRYDVLYDRDDRDEENLINTFTTFLQTKTAELMDEIIRYTDLEEDQRMLEFLNTIDSWKLKGENIYMSLEDETSEEFYTYAKNYIANLLKVYPTIIIDSGGKTDYKTPSVPQHWTTGAQKLSNTHIKDVKNIISKEFSELYQFYGDEKLKGVLFDISNSEISNVIIKVSEMLPFFADIRMESGAPRSKTILNGDIIRRIMKYLITKSLHNYITITDSRARQEDTVDESKSVIGEELELDILRGRALELRQKTAGLLRAYLSILNKQKSIINISNDEINLQVNKSKEKEKAKVTRNLGNLTVEERQVQDIMKNHRIGEWALGQTRALFVYDEEQYEKERQELELDALNEMQINAIDGVTERTREIYQLDWAEQQYEDQRVANEISAEIMAMGDDDDMGEREGYM